VRNAKLKGDTCVSDRPDCYWFPSRNQFLVGFSKLCYCNFMEGVERGQKNQAREKRALNSGMTSLGKVRAHVNVFQPPFHFTVFFSTYTRSRRSTEFFMHCLVQAIVNYKNIAESLVTNVFFGAAVWEPFSLAKPLDIFQRFGNNVTKRNNGLR